MNDDNTTTKPETISTKTHHIPQTVTIKQSHLIYVLLTIILMILSFWGGVIFNNHQIRNRNTNTIASYRIQHRIKKHRLIFRGTITKVSANSITVSNNLSGQTKTITILSSTLILNSSGQTIPESSLSPNQNVLVRLNSSQTSAVRIILNNPNTGSNTAN